VNVVWFKRDLRLADHAPLAAAIERGEPLLLLYIVEPMLLRDPHYRGRHWHFIGQSLQAMNDELAMLGAQIQVLEGEPVSLLNTLHQSQPISHLYSHEETGLGVTFERDRQVAAFCAAQGIAWHEYQTNGIQRGRCDRRGWNGAWQRVMSDAEIPLDLNSLPL
jgi:deoxyribodipyrimidine photo-lyase